MFLYVIIIYLNIKNKIGTMNIVKKSFYLTSIFSDAVPDSSWTSIERKTTLALFSYLDPYKIYLPDTEDEQIEKLLENIPLEFCISKKEWMDITGVTVDNFSREIKSVRQGLIKKSFNTPHPTDPNKDSGDSISWFSKVTYSAKESKLKLKINSDALENLVSFVKYTKINFEFIKPLKSSYSVYTYIFLKIIKDISNNKKKTQEIIEIEELKLKLGLVGKYTKIHMFKERVLDIVKTEINKYTDLDFNYELEKDGRSYRYINLYFDYKPQSVLEAPKIVTSTNDENHTEFNWDEGVEDSPFENTLFSWGIRVKQIAHLESAYSPKAIEEAINITEEMFKKGNVKTTRASLFIGTLKNTQQKEDEQSVQSDINETNRLEVTENLKRDKIMQEKEKIFNHITSLIYLHEEEFKKVLSALSFGVSSLDSITLTEEFRKTIYNLSMFKAEMFRGYAPHTKVFEEGYYNQELARLANPDMFTFLSKITTVI